MQLAMQKVDAGGNQRGMRNKTMIWSGLRFNNSDWGYYWCQMIVNNVTLSPSPYGYIYHSQCVPLDAAICSLHQPICAHSLSGLQFMAYANSSHNCILREFYVATTSRTASRNSSSILINDISQSTDEMMLTISSTVSRGRLGCDLSHNYICAAGIVTGLVVFIISSLVVVVLCFIIRKKQKMSRYKNILL